jgi:hypothetical protein
MNPAMGLASARGLRQTDRPTAKGAEGGTGAHGRHERGAALNPLDLAGSAVLCLGRRVAPATASASASATRSTAEGRGQRRNAHRHACDQCSPVALLLLSSLPLFLPVCLCRPSPGLGGAEKQIRPPPCTQIHTHGLSRGRMHEAKLTNAGTRHRSTVRGSPTVCLTVLCVLSHRLTHNLCPPVCVAFQFGHAASFYNTDHATHRNDAATSRHGRPGQLICCHGQPSPTAGCCCHHLRWFSHAARVAALPDSLAQHPCRNIDSAAYVRCANACAEDLAVVVASASPR